MGKSFNSDTSLRCDKSTLVSKTTYKVSCKSSLKTKTENLTRYDMPTDTKENKSFMVCCAYSMQKVNTKLVNKFTVSYTAY